MPAREVWAGPSLGIPPTYVLLASRGPSVKSR